MQYSTPTPATRVSAPLTNEAARSRVASKPGNAQPNAFASMYPPLPAYETSLTAHRPPMPTSASTSSVQKPVPAPSQVTGQQQSQNAPAQGHSQSSALQGSRPAQSTPRAQQKKPDQQSQTYSVEVSSKALRVSKARISFTTLRYNILYALVLYIASSSRPYRMLAHAVLRPEWFSLLGHVENALLTLFLFNCCWATYRLWTLPPAGPGNVNLNFPSPVKNRTSTQSLVRSSPSSRPSTPYAASPISKPVVSRFHPSPSANTQSPGQALQQPQQGSPFRSVGAGGPPGSGTPTSRLRAALLGQSPASPPGNTSASSFGSPQRGVQGSPGAAAMGYGQAPANSPAREAFLSRHSASDASPRRVMSERAALQALS